MSTTPRSFFFVSIFFLFSSANHANIDPTVYQSHAQAWIKKHVISGKKPLMDPQEMQLVANLLYFSYLRSAITLEAQIIAFDTLESVWEGWQNIAQTRMNPSLETPYEMGFNKQQTLFKNFMMSEYAHRSLGQTYANAAEAAVKEKHLGQSAHGAVMELREEARKVVIIAFLDIKKILGDLYHFASEHTRVDQLIGEDDIRFDLMDSLSTYIPGLAMKSFIEAERINTQASEKSWEIVRTIVEINQRIWDAIESARASYYLAHYEALILVMLENNLDTKYYRIMFDEQGMIASSDQEYYLPGLA